MPKPSPMPDAPAAVDLPPDLERRIAALESAGRTGDLDAVSWFWLILLGIVLPAALLVWGALT